MMKEHVLPRVLPERKHSVAASARLFALSLVAMLCAVVLGAAAPAQAAALYSASVAPTTATPSQTQSYTLTITNTASSTSVLGSSYYTIPSGFTALTGLGTPVASGGKTWNAVINAGTQIRLSASSDANRLAAGETVSVAFTMTAPAAPATYAFTGDAKLATNHTGAGHTIVGAEPGIVVAAAPNNAPVTVDDPGFTVNEDGNLFTSPTSVLTNDTDADADTLTAVLVTGPANGSFVGSLNSDGTFEYVPDPDFNGTDSFTYKANDGTDDGNIATVTITVNAVADAPVATGDTYNANEDTALDTAASALPAVLANDTDGDGDSLTAVLDTDVSNGTLVLNADGSFTYTPDADFQGADSFTYHANDGASDSSIVTVNITVAAVNDAPVAVDDSGASFTVAEDGTLITSPASVLTNDTDTEGDTLTAILVTGPANGSFIGSLNSDGTFEYIPNADFNGTDSFTYKANDGASDSNTVTVTITVTAVNDDPTASADSYNVTQDTLLTVPVATGVLNNDTDTEGDSLTAILNATTPNGTLNLSADGSFTYQPNSGFTGPDSFTYFANDGTGNSTFGNVTITVGPVFTISGFVRIGNVIPVQGVDVTRTGGVTVQTDVTGKFTFTNVVPGSYFITASSASYTFLPATTGLLVSTANRACNFIATPIVPTYTVTGRVITTNSVGIGGVTIARNGGGAGTPVVTNSAGYYTLTNVPSGTYNVTATLAGHTFSPAPRVVVVAGANVSGANFTSGFTISGRVNTSSGVGISGVVISTGGGPTATSNSAGYYTIHGVQPGVINLTPTLAGSTFTPGNPTVTITNANASGHNFIRVTGP